MICFYLLRKQPQIVVNGESMSFSPQVLKLLIYLAESGESEYNREILIRLIYGTEFARDTFRKKILYSVRQEIPELTLETRRGDLLHFSREQVWVDSLVFAQETRDLLSFNRHLNKKDYQRAQTILTLYDEPFLLDYHPKSSESGNDRQFLSWLQERRRALTSLYHRLLDEMILYCLKQQRNWDMAQAYAERWRRDPEPSAKPLQYLIWLAVHQQHETLNDYLAELRTHEESGEVLIGPSSEVWKQLLKARKPLPLSVLLPQDTFTESQPHISVVAPTQRPDVAEQILKVINSLRPEQVLGITGLPGVGKTELGHEVARLLLERNPDWQVLRPELTEQLDFELLCNNLLDDLGQRDLFRLDYAKKQHRLKQLLQAPNLLVIVDEGLTTYLANSDVRNKLLAIVGSARTMLIARQLPRFDHYVIDLSGLDKRQTKEFLISRNSWLAEIEEVQLEEIANLTAGLPLLLHVISGGLKKELGRIDSLLEYLKAQDSPLHAGGDIYAIYQRVLTWLWQYLDSKDKNLLYAISLFAWGEGTSAEDLKLVLTNVISEARLLQRINRLIEMRLIQRRSDSLAEAHYNLHPIILDFVRQQAQHRRRPYTSMIDEAYIRYLLDFISSYHAQIERLDKHKQNVFQMFDLVFFRDDYRWARPQAVEALNQIFPYFEMRGLYATASRLIARVLELGAFDSAEAHIRMMRNAAKIAYLQANDEGALKLYEHALVLARSARTSSQDAGLYYDIGNVHLERGRLEQAVKSFEAAERVVDSERQQRLLYSIWSNLGACTFRQGHFDLALQQYHKVLDHLGKSGAELPPELRMVAQFVQTWLGLTYTELGDYEAAMQHYRESMVLARLINYPQLTGYLYLNMGFTYCYRKEYGEAEACFTQAEIIASQIQHANLQTLVIFNQGVLASRRFLHREAFYLHREALNRAETYEITWLKPQILISFGKAYLRNEQFDHASQRFGEALTLPEVTPLYIGQAIYGLALSDLLNVHAIGKNDVEVTLDLIQPILEEIPGSPLQLRETESYLAWVHNVFQRDLDHLPQLERYRVTEALKIWLSDK